MSGIVPNVFVERINAIHAKIEAALGEEGRSVFYSAYETEVISGIGTVPVENLHKTAVEGTVIFELEDFRSAPLTDPTWLDVAVVANAAIIATDTLHSNFLEGVADTGRTTDDGVRVYRLCTEF